MSLLYSEAQKCFTLREMCDFVLVCQFMVQVSYNFVQQVHDHFLLAIFYVELEQTVGGGGVGGQGKAERNVVSIAPPSPYCFIVSIIQPLAENQRWQPFNPFIKIKEATILTKEIRSTHSKMTPVLLATSKLETGLGLSPGYCVCPCARHCTFTG